MCNEKLTQVETSAVEDYGRTAIRRHGLFNALWLAALVWSFVACASIVTQLSVVPTLAELQILPLAAEITSGVVVTALLFLALRKAGHLPATSRIATTAGALLAAIGAQSVLDELIEWLLIPVDLTHLNDQHVVLWAFISNFVVYITPFSIFLVGLLLTEKAADLRDREQALRAARTEFEIIKLAAERYKLDPAFMRRALASLSELALSEDARKADEMVVRLADFLRVCLVGGRANTAPLVEELGMVAAYVEIEQVRLGDRLHISVDCPAELLDVPVPSFLLQPLVERALPPAFERGSGEIWLKIRVRAHPGFVTLSLSCDRGRRTRTREIAPVDTATDARALGAARRLQLMYGDRARVDTATRGQSVVTTARFPNSGDRPILVRPAA